MYGMIWCLLEQRRDGENGIRYYVREWHTNKAGTADPLKMTS